MHMKKHGIISFYLLFVWDVLLTDIHVLYDFQKWGDRIKYFLHPACVLIIFAACKKRQSYTAAFFPPSFEILWFLWKQGVLLLWL